MKTFKQYLRVYRTAPLTLLLWQCGFLLFGVLMVVIINATINDDMDYAPMGTMLALMASLPGLLMMDNMMGGARFRLAVSMGQTRRAYLLGDTAVGVLMVLLALVSANVIFHLEMGFYRLLYPGYTPAMEFLAAIQGMLTNWKILLPVALAILLGQVVLTGISLRFGNSVFSIVWVVLCIVPFLMGQAVGQYKHGGTSLIAQLGGMICRTAAMLSPVVWACAGAAVGALLLVLSVRWFLQAEVRL